MIALMDPDRVDFGAGLVTEVGVDVSEGAVKAFDFPVGLRRR